MIILLPGNPKSSGFGDKIFSIPNVGFLITPQRPCRMYSQMLDIWAVDSAAYALGDKFNPENYFSFIESVMDYSGECIFATCPDKVGDYLETNKLWERYYSIMKSYGVPLAYVAQDGLAKLPEYDFQVLFIGGTDEFKLGPLTVNLVNEAKEKDLHVHMGRVNSVSRFRYAKSLGVDSIDGSGWGKYDDPGKHKLSEALLELWSGA